MASPTTSTTTTTTASLLQRATTCVLCLLVLLSLTGVATAQRHPSYNERMVNSAHIVAQARARALAEQQAAVAAAAKGTPPPDDVSESPWTGLREAHTARLVRQLSDVDPRELRQVVLQSLDDLSEGRHSSSSSSSSSGRGVVEESGSAEAVKETPEDSQRCLNHTAEMIIGLAENRTWSLKMVDAMGKPGPAVSEGNLLWVGAYDMCNKIRAYTPPPSPQPLFSGKYCNAHVQISATPNLMGVPATVTLGLCVPDTCSEFDMSYLLTDVANRLGFKYQIGVMCPPESKPLDAKAIVALVLCSILLLCLVFGTAVDVVLQLMEKQRQQEATAAYLAANGHTLQEERLPLITKAQTPPQPQPSILLKVFIAFSVYTNGRKLLCTRQQAGSLTCVHGIRFLSMTWVVLGHVYLFPLSFGENVGPYMMEFINRWTAQGIANALVSVDSFFVLSGLLVSYLTLKELYKRQGKLNWFMFYFHRFWRLTPAYMLVIMVYLCLSPYWGNGPLWPEVNPDRDSCEDHWWTNLLYLNNLVYTDKMCLGQSWYLANDMQFYCVLSPLVILPLYYFPVAGYVVSAVLVLAHCVTNAALTIHNNYPPGMFAQVKGASPANMAKWGPDFYMKPYTRWGPYVIGMLAGYFLYVTKCKLIVKWHVNSLLWGLATAAALAVLYGLYGASTGDPMTLSMSAFYNAMHRNVWAVCLCWVIVACVTGNGGFVNTLLSWPGFIPLSRLTYCIYLLHILIMNLYLGNSRTLFYYSDINVVMFFLSVLIVSYMAAAVASLAFEAPMMALEKVLLSRDQPRDNNQPKREEQPAQEQQNGFYTKN